jgi:hypothetical protein
VAAAVAAGRQLVQAAEAEAAALRERAQAEVATADVGYAGLGRPPGTPAGRGRCCAAWATPSRPWRAPPAAWPTPRRPPTPPPPPGRPSRRWHGECPPGCVAGGATRASSAGGSRCWWLPSSAVHLALVASFPAVRVAGRRSPSSAAACRSACSPAGPSAPAGTAVGDSHRESRLRGDAATMNCPPGHSAAATVRNTAAWSGSQCSVATLTAAETDCGKCSGCRRSAWRTVTRSRLSASAQLAQHPPRTIDGDDVSVRQQG